MCIVDIYVELMRKSKECVCVCVGGDGGRQHLPSNSPILCQFHPCFVLTVHWNWLNKTVQGVKCVDFLHSISGFACGASSRPSHGGEKSDSIQHFYDLRRKNGPTSLNSCYTLNIMRLSKLQSTTSLRGLGCTSLRRRLRLTHSAPSSSWVDRSCCLFRLFSLHICLWKSTQFKHNTLFFLSWYIVTTSKVAAG